jgi:chromosomal replication initiator protein
MEGERMNGVWQKAADRMRDSLGQVGYETWICPLNFLGLQDKTATIEVPNRFFRDYMTDKYLELLRQSLSAEVGEPREIQSAFRLWRRRTGQNPSCYGDRPPFMGHWRARTQNIVHAGRGFHERAHQLAETRSDGRVQGKVSPRRRPDS